MSSTDLLAFGSLISQVWRLFTSFELPIINITPAELFIGFSFISLVAFLIRNLTQTVGGDNK